MIRPGSVFGGQVNIEKRIVSILKDEVNRYEECGRRVGGLGSVQVTYEARTLNGIGYQGRESNSPKLQWIVPDPETAKIHSDNLDRLLPLLGSSEARDGKVVSALLRRVDKSLEYASIGYFFLLALYRMGLLDIGLTAIYEKLRGDAEFGFDDAVRMLSGLLQYEYPRFTNAMLDSAERFAEKLEGHDHLLGKRIVAARARLNSRNGIAGAMDSKNEQQRIMGILHAIATKSLEMPENEREAYLQRKKQEAYEDAITAGMTEERAGDLSKQMDEWSRALIRMIQTSGGSPGGRA